MAAYLKVITPSLATKLPCNAHRSIPMPAGEAIAAGDPCYNKSDGTIWRSNGTTNGASSQVDGWATIDYAVGTPTTLYHNVHLAYGPSNATLGSKLYLSATPGQLDTATTTGGTDWIAKVDYIASGEGTPHAVLFVRKSTY